MAKFVGLVGTGSGRAGNQVFCKGPNGSTIVKTYQPVVANPRTEGQLNQRAIMVLAGKISKICSAPMISGLMKGSKLKNRSRFLRQIALHSVATYAQGVHSATIASEDIIFSEGVVPFAATGGNVTLAANSVTVALSNVNADGHNGERVVVLVLSPVVGSASYRMGAFTDVVYENNTSSVVVNLPYTLEDGEKVLVYRCPFRLVTEGLSCRTAGVWLGTDITAQLTQGASAVAEFGQSILAGESVNNNA